MEDDILTLGEQFGNNGMNNNAFSYQPIPSAPLPTGSMYPDWVNKIESPNISKDITPEINSIVQDIRYSAMDSLQTKGKSGSDSVLNEMFPNKIQTQYDVPITQTHEMLSDGKTWIPKYKTYLPGADNEALNASQQSNWEKYFNPLKKFGIKVGRGVVADIGSFVYGIGEAAITGRAESIFDNDMSNYIDDLDKKTDFNYKNYYTEAQNGLGANLYTWDKILGGAEFTARMLGAEAIIAAATGGASLPANFARVGARLGLESGSTAFRIFRAAETLEDVAEVGARASKINRIVNQPVVNVASRGGGAFSAERYAQGLQSAINAGNKADLLKQARFAITGSMYESGFEARHYQNEAENTFWDYYRQKGTEPTQEEIDKFYNKLDDTAWAVFGSNMAILSTSNMALFGNMMNIKNPFTKLANGSFVDRTIFRVGTEKTAEGLWRPLQKGFFNKAAAFATPVLKGAAIEGVYEEGSQGIASNMMKNYIASTYDPKAMKETSDYMSSFTKAFKDQYSTKEGIEEIVIGGIIGGLFGGVHAAGQVRDTYNRQGFIAQVQNAMPQVADNIVSNLYTNESLSNVIGHANRLQGIGDRQNSARINGDIVGDAMHSAESFISMLQASSSVGKSDEFLSVLKASLAGMDAAQLAEGQNIKTEDVEAFKAEKIAGVEKLAEDYAKAREAATFLFGRGNIGGFYEIEGQKVNKSNLIDAFAYTSTMGAVSQQISSDAFSAFQQKLGEIGTDASIVEQYGSLAALQTAGNMELARYTQATNDETRLSKQRKKLEDQLLKLQSQEVTPEITQKLQQIADKLLEVGNEISQANQNKDLYWKAIADNFYKNLSTKGFLPQIDFENFNKNVNSLQEALDKSSIAEYDKLELNKLLEEFDKSNEAYKSFNNLAQSMANPKFTFKIYNNIFSGFRAKSDKSLNDVTKTALIDLYNTNTKIRETLTSFQPIPSLVTDDVITSMNNDLEYQMPQEVLDDVRNKVKNNVELSENEKQVYDRFKEDIDTSINAINEDPLNVNTEEADISPITAQISALRNEIAELENGNITPSIQSEIDSINKQIEDLKTEFFNLTQNQSNVNTDDKIIEIERKRKKELSELDSSGKIIFDESSKTQGKNVARKEEEVNKLEKVLPKEITYTTPDGKKRQTIKLTKVTPIMGNWRITYTYENGSDINLAIDHDNQLAEKNEAQIKLVIAESLAKNSGFGKGLSKISVEEAIGDIFDSIVTPTDAELDEILLKKEQINAKYDIELKRLKEAQNPRNNKIDLTISSGNFQGDFLNDYDFLAEGSESTVYRSKDGNSVIKIGEPYGSNSEALFNSRIDNVLLGNSILGDGSLSVIGYYEMNGVKNPIFSQNFVSGEALSEEEVKAELIKNGALEIDGTIYLKNKGKTYEVLDLTDNYFKNENGDLIGIDVSMYETKDSVEGLDNLKEYNSPNKVESNNENESTVNREEEIQTEIASLESNKQFLVEDRISDINSEIEELKSKEQADKKLAIKKDRLANRIGALRENILRQIAEEVSQQRKDLTIKDVEGGSVYQLERLKQNDQAEREIRIRNKELLKKPYYTQLRKLRKLESELRALNTIKQDFNPDASYVDQLQWILDNNSIINYENVDTLTSASPPSTEDVTRYSDLASKKRKTKAETAEMAELREKLLPYRIVEGSEFGGIPLVDIINVYNQLRDVKTTEDNQIESLPEEDVQKAIYQVQTQEFTPEYRAANVGLVYDGTYLRGGSNIQRLFHIRLNSMLNAALNNSLPTTVTEFRTENGNVTYSDEIVVTPENVTDIANRYDNFGGVRINIGDEVILEKSERGVNFNVTGDIASLLNLRPYAITGQPNSYNLLYEEKSDGSFAPKQSEYQVTRNGNEVPFDKETLNRLQPGDDVTLYFDINDDYNQTLSPDEYSSKGNIYVMKNGKLVNILKANTNYETSDSGWAALANLRKQVVEAGVTNQTVTTSIKNSYLGLPIINIGADGRAIEQPIIEDIVVSYGYLNQDGTYNFFDNVNVDNYQYTDPYKELGKNVPLMAFRYNGKVYTFPIQIESQSINAENELDNVLNNTEINDYVKMFQVNSILAKYNLNSDELMWTIENNTIPAIREALSSVNGKVDITNESQFKEATKSTLLDMNDPFMSAKLVLNIQTAEEILNDTDNKTKGDAIVKPITNKGEDLAEDNMC